MNIQIVPMTDELLKVVADNMREADRLECWRLASDPLGALRKSRADSDSNAICLIDGEPMAAYGLVTKRHPIIGYPWLLTTTLVEDYKRTFLEGSLKVIDAMLAKRPVLNAYVDVEHAQALRWAKWMGFAWGEAIPYGPMKRPFFPIFKTSDEIELVGLTPAAGGIH